MWVSPKLQSFPPNPTGQSQEYVSQLSLHVPPFWHGFDLQKGSLALQPNTDTEHYLTAAAANHRNITISIIIRQNNHKYSQNSTIPFKTFFKNKSLMLTIYLIL